MRTMKTSGCFPQVLAFFLCAVLGTALPSTTNAAVITKSQKEICVLRLDGEIVEGDLSRLETMAATAYKGVDGESSAADTICLNSPGGSVAEGVRLSEYFYKNAELGSKCHKISAFAGTTFWL